MTSPFLSELRDDLSDAELELLTDCNIHSPDALYAFTMTFPTLATRGIDVPKLSNYGARFATSAVMTVGSAIQTKGPPLFPYGVSDPEGAPPSVGSTIPPQSRPSSALPNPSKLDYRLPNWNVRDQGDRGTCVAHALAAVREYVCGAHPLSPQFLFWATKKRGGDPFPDDDGSRLEYAHAALASDGICSESHWPYDGTPNPTNTTHGAANLPSHAATKDAEQHKSHGWMHPPTKGNAKRLFEQLDSHKRPVAISLPVFAALGTEKYTNWNTAPAVVNGSVIDPAPTAVVVGAHAVCVTGFLPDPNELLGGYFVFKNSWGTMKWSRSPPADALSPPEAGYGTISATYIERYLWEMCQLA